PWPRPVEERVAKILEGDLVKRADELPFVEHTQRVAGELAGQRLIVADFFGDPFDSRRPRFDHSVEELGCCFRVLVSLLEVFACLVVRDAFKLTVSHFHPLVASTTRRQANQGAHVVASEPTSDHAANSKLTLAAKPERHAP